MLGGEVVFSGPAEWCEHDENYRDIDAFKIYVSDLGLLCAKKDLAANDILYMTDE